jgi:hypothetical protein
VEAAPVLVTKIHVNPVAELGEFRPNLRLSSRVELER